MVSTTQAGFSAPSISTVTRDRASAYGEAISRALPHALQVADRVALLKNGTLMALGPPAQTLTPETLKSLYGIDVVVGMVPGSSALVCAPRSDPPV